MNDAELLETIKNIRNFLIFNHLFCAFTIIVGQRVNKAFFTLMQCMIIFATMSQIFTTIWVSQIIFVDDKSID